jgi:hypothetical protein
MLVVDVAGVLVVLVSLLLLKVVGLLIEVPQLQKKYCNIGLMYCNYRDSTIGPPTFDFRYSNCYRTDVARKKRFTAFLPFSPYLQTLRIFSCFPQISHETTVFAVAVEKVTSYSKKERMRSLEG